MNRTPSQTAKILNVDIATVKRWAFVFKEHLSSAANPPSGKDRVFSDADVLALYYVGDHWEDDPDLEAIKAGLDDGDHLEDKYREHLYRHTPLLQEPPDDLDETWRHGILLCGGGRYEYLELARNYRHVAESMLKAALKNDDLDHWAYPVLFAYRHTLELYLKIIGEIDEVTHSLARCMHLVEKRFGGKKFKSPIREWILQLEEIDPGGTAFRYADEDGHSRCAEYWFDFVHFKFAMTQVFDEIDWAILHSDARGRAAKKKKTMEAH